MKTQRCIPLLLFVLLQACCQQSHVVYGAKCGSTILKEDFNDYPGSYKFVGNAAGARKLFPLGSFVPGGYAGMDRLLIGKKVAKVNIRKGCSSASAKAWDDRSCGVRLMWRLPRGGVDEATLTYRVKFSSNYGWTSGGKLPGLGAEQNPQSCQSRYPKSSGWSTRVMFRKQGKIVGYAYRPYKPRPPSCGLDLSQKTVKAKDGAGMKEVKMYIKLNRPDQSNGRLQLWYDGRQVYSSSSVRFRYYSKHKIQRFIFHVYHGGKADDKRFQAPKDQSIWFDDFRIRTGRCAPSSSKDDEEEDEEDGPLPPFAEGLKDTFMHGHEDFMAGLFLSDDDLQESDTAGNVTDVTDGLTMADFEDDVWDDLGEGQPLEYDVAAMQLRAAT